MAGPLAEEYPVRLVCQVLDVAASSFYYRPSPRDDSALQAAIRTLAGQWPTYGYRRMTAELQRAGWAVNHKRVARLMAAMGLKVRRRRSGPRTTDSDHNGPRFPNPVSYTHLDVYKRQAQRQAGERVDEVDERRRGQEQQTERQ